MRETGYEIVFIRRKSCGAGRYQLGRYGSTWHAGPCGAWTCDKCAPRKWKERQDDFKRVIPGGILYTATLHGQGEQLTAALRTVKLGSPFFKIALRDGTTVVLSNSKFDGATGRRRDKIMMEIDVLVNEYKIASIKVGRAGMGRQRHGEKNAPSVYVNDAPEAVVKDFDACRNDKEHAVFIDENLRAGLIDHEEVTRLGRALLQALKDGTLTSEHPDFTSAKPPPARKSSRLAKTQPGTARPRPA